jgi:hypothetical protein
MLASNLIFGQTQGSVIEIKNPAIDSLIARRTMLNNMLINSNLNSKSTDFLLYGYRVQVYFGANRKTAYQAVAKIKALFPQFESYISYNQPNYRIKIGDFRTRLEAAKLVSQLRLSFSTLFIFNEQINPPKTEDYHVDR